MNALCTRSQLSLLSLGATLLVCMLVGGVAQAGIPECGNIRLEDAAACELQVSGGCEASCAELGIYKKACATQQFERCTKTECTLKAELTCQDPCTDACERACDLGANINCQHNCFGECVGACDGRCADADSPENCRASCEATCDGECDAKCVGVDGDCYYHCTECCHGSCSAEANLDCQERCQLEEMEVCEHELRVDCSAACDVDGALFCDGEFVISGSQKLTACAEALLARGLLDLGLEAQARALVDDQSSGGTSVDVRGSADSAAGGCRLAPATTPAGDAYGLGLLGLGLTWLGRRRLTS